MHWAYKALTTELSIAYSQENAYKMMRTLEMHTSKVYILSTNPGQGERMCALEIDPAPSGVCVSGLWSCEC